VNGYTAGKGSKGDEGKFLRICGECGETIVRIRRGEMESALRNNPELVTEHIKGLSRYCKPEAN
jgi:hypothetical protein